MFKSWTRLFAFHFALMPLGIIYSSFSGYSWIVRRTGFFSVSLATNLGEGKLWIQHLYFVTLYRWPAKQTIPFSVLVRNQTKGFWTWNLGVAGRGNGTREAVGVELRTGAVDTGAVRTVAEKIGSSEEDRVRRCRHSSCFVEFSLVIHASVSPYMLSEM